MRVLQEIFQLPEMRYRQSLDELTDLLDLEPPLHKPLRNLSLGERMKVELAAALIHRRRLDPPGPGQHGGRNSRRMVVRRLVLEAGAAQLHRRLGLNIHWTEISATPASAHTTPIACAGERRSWRTAQASMTVVTGNNEASTAARLTSPSVLA